MKHFDSAVLAIVFLLGIFLGYSSPRKPPEQKPDVISISGGQISHVQD
jgi:hypothetical protein